METSVAAFDGAGFVVIPAVISPDHCQSMLAWLPATSDPQVGSRNLLEHHWCQELASLLRTDARIAPFLPTEAVAVQCTLFDKSSEKNWLVAFHQDLSIPVHDRVDAPECSGWSEKEGSLFVQPPTRVLEELLAVRVHLDDCGLDNGALRVVPGSHRLGRLRAGDMAEHRRARGDTPCTTARGGALLMRPLLLHASSKAVAVAPRRVLHFVYGPRHLPCGLQWHHAV